MASGLLVWFFWICSFLLNGSDCLPTAKGYGYPYVSDWRNIGDDGDDEVFNSPVTSLAHQTDLVPTSQNLPNAPSAHDWGLDNLDKPLAFPLRPNNQLSDPAKPQLSPIQTQSSASHTSTSEVPVSHTEYALSYAPHASSHSAIDYSFANQNPASSAAGGGSRNVPHLVFEEVFHYPSENTDGFSAPSYGGVSSNAGGYSVANEPGLSPYYASTLENPPFSSYLPNVGAHSVYPSEMVNLDFSPTYYEPFESSSWLKQEPVLGTQKAEVSPPILPPPSSYIIQSRNGYQRGRRIVTNSRYTPEFRVPMTFTRQAVKSTAPSQPAAPKGVKNPQRTNW